MKQATGRIDVNTRGKGLYVFTREVARWLSEQGIRTGLVTIFLQHTSASLTIQENADPDVLEDMRSSFDRLAPEDESLYLHTIEGPDDMPAHVKSSLSGVQLSIPVIDGRMALGTWQGLYVFEHRAQAHRRSVVLHVIGE